MTTVELLKRRKDLLCYIMHSGNPHKNDKLEELARIEHLLNLRSMYEHS